VRRRRPPRCGKHRRSRSEIEIGAIRRDKAARGGIIARISRLCELRRRQIEAWAEAEPRQPALFELKTDCRPHPGRTAAGRYRQPSLLDDTRGDRKAV
jgi:hypothetical protein